MIFNKKEEQAFANSLANFCHAYGKTLPTRWQNFAKGLKNVGKIVF